MLRCSRELLVFCALALGLVACRGDKDTAAASPPKKPSPVESKLSWLKLEAQQVARLGLQTAPVERRKLPETLAAVGDLIARPGRSSVIQAPVAGVLSAGQRGASSPMPGAALKAGQVVFRLLPLVAPHRNLQAEARRDVELARTRATTASRQVERLTELGKEGAGDQPALETRQAESSMANAELEAAQTRLDQLRGGSPLTSDVSLALKAPQDGVLVRLHATGGQSVNAGAPLFEVAELDHLWVEVPVYVGDLERVDRGASAALTSLGGTVGPAPVSAVPVPAPALGDANTATARLFYEIDNAKMKFSPGQRVALRLPLLGRGEERHVVPYSAIVYDVLGGAWVYVERAAHEFERVRVELERVHEGLAVLNRGPSEGARVVTAGVAELFGTEFGAGK